MKNSIKSTLVLICVCAFITAALAVTNSITAPIIAKNEEAAANDALLQVLPDGKNFEKLDITTYSLPATVTEAYKAENGGYVLKLETSGYAAGLVIMCGVDAEGKVAGTVILSSGETPSIGGAAADTLAGALVGKDAAGIDGVDTISGATKTTGAYRAAVKDALNAAIILGGGDVDIRTEEEILNDNLSASLPAADGKFTKLFITEVITGIDAIYKADNGKGAVCVVGEQFIALDENYNVITEVDAELASTVKEQAEKALTSTSEDVDLGKYQGLPSALISAKLTASGNYVLELRASGYGINGNHYIASGEYIKIRVSMTADGKIIDCLTVSQAESKGYGDACADEKFYGQFDGKTQENYGDIDGIAGATFTTSGYKTAILRAFESVIILKGGAE
ncbi:MAG: FMN-binding protein [Clostridia bacterium]|nr:FMN-binding protein [Clostridia bacterium]